MRLLAGAPAWRPGSAAAILVVLAFFGAYLLVPALIALAVDLPRLRTRSLQTA